MLKIGLLCVAAIAASPSAGFAATYYFSATGSDVGGDGSLANPYQSLTKLNSLSYTAGDSIYLRGGDTFSGSLYFDNNNALGSAANPITLSSYGSGKATISSGTAAGLFAYNTGGWNISNLSFVGGSGNAQDGVGFYHERRNTMLNHVYIDNVEVSSYGGKGITFGSWDGRYNYYDSRATQGWNDVRITNTLSHHNTDNGIFVWGQTTSSNTNVYMGNNKAWNNGRSGLLIANTNGGVIERSVAHNNGTAQTGAVGIWAYDANAITIQFNESYSNKTPGATDGGGFDLDGGVTNSVMQYNYSHGNDGAGFMVGEYAGSTPTTGNVVRYNISQNDGQKNNYGGIHLYNWNSPTNRVTNNAIYNNTVFNSSGGGNVVVHGNMTGSNNRLANNIFITAGLVPNIRNGTTGLQFTGNLYWNVDGTMRIIWGGTTYTSLNAWLTAVTNQERLTLNGQTQIVALLQDPQLVDAGGGTAIGDANMLYTLTAYMLMSSSAAADAGFDLAALFGINPGDHDFYGIPIPQGGGFSMGASEIPEPATLMLSAALGGALLVRRRRA